MMNRHAVHAFGDDALGRHDAVALTELVRNRTVHPDELATAALTRLDRVDSVLHAVARPLYESPRHATDPRARLYGVPTFIKDNTDLAGLPTTHGSEAFVASPARNDGAYARQLHSTGLSLLGKSRMPEFGLNASTEFAAGPPTRNPWHTGFSSGASSGGAAALVAAGVVPIAHGNDGGGSIRCPAASAGLVGLKPSRGRHVNGEQAKTLPINIISEGVLTRSVRDTAAYVAAAEDYWRNPKLKPVGLVEGTSSRRLHIGLQLDTIVGVGVDAQNRAAVERTAALLEGAGHTITPAPLPFGAQFAEDFVHYFALLADLSLTTAKVHLDWSFDPRLADGFNLGLRRHHRARWAKTPATIVRLRQAARAYARFIADFDAVISPVTAHTTPPIGHLSPHVPFDRLLERLLDYV
ncbi:amidase, partial [Mycobacterium sp.]|uniref:amidase n=1 Tax=Mycobacterium sp. TaxID=1785 RepID=UPI002F415469